MSLRATFAARRLDIGLLVLRVGASGMMAVHGLEKAKTFSETAAWFAEVRPLGLPGAAAAGLAIFAELVCSVLVALGWLTRWAALPPLVTMAVAAFQVQMAGGWFAMESAVLYAVVFAAIAFIGPGAYSLDGRHARQAPR
jgi:putative oxidoreductase